MKKILLLGSTGSIGNSTVNTIRRFPDKFKLVGLAANRRYQELADQAKEFEPEAISLFTKEYIKALKDLSPKNIDVFEGEEGLLKMTKELDYDILLNALVGAAGFKSTVAALKRGKRVALANKESLVIGGDFIMNLVKQYGGELIPVDSEHSAILQCLSGEDLASIEKITVTASGGPFRTLNINKFREITVSQALDHPTWAMGNKITIDSSTLVNKGFEVIEAHYFFKIPYANIEVLVHPQSIIHSMVTFKDGAVMAQCGLPDMELPIQYALSYPKRLPISAPRLDLAKLTNLTFENPDFEKFPALKHCLDAGKEGGTSLTVLNAANEIAVKQFLKENINYSDIPLVIEKMLNNHSNQKADSVEIILDTDAKIRTSALELTKSMER